MDRPTQKQLRFVAAYLETGNRVEAYRRSYDCQRMSARTVARKAQEVAEIPHVASLILERQNEAMKRNEVDVDSTVQELAVVAFSDITEFLEFNSGRVRLKDLSTIPARKRACIKELEVAPNGSFSITLHDKLRALNTLAKHLGMFERKMKKFDYPIIQFIREEPRDA